MSESESRSEVVLELAEEFLERYRRGERPPLREYIARHPELAAEIKEVFPAMAMMENIAVADESLVAPGQESGAKSPTTPALRQLGDYRIIREIGRGGMGLVYEAEQVSLGRHVALKVLLDNALCHAKHKRRFEREARAAAKLHHTNIVPVFGVGEHDGLPYYVMQFIQGLGLDAVLGELQHMQPGTAPTPSGLPTAGEIRFVRRDVAAAEVARSLMTGEFQPSASDGPGLAAIPRPVLGATMAEPAEGGADKASGVASAPWGPRASENVSGPAPDASSPSTATGRLSDSLSASSSSITLPGAAGSGSRSAAKKQNYWHSVAHIGRQVADALAYAHKQGVLHRDIKPSNLLLDLRGTVWVADFGLAKVSGPGAEGENLTHAGDILGTLRYMPPEAFDGCSDARGDVYALGLTLYEMLTLRPAYEEKDRHKLIKQVTTAEPAALDKVNAKIPRDLVTIIHKAIAREPGRRYATADDLASDLQRFLDDEPILARRQTQMERYVRWARHNPGMAALGGVLTAVLVLATLASLIVAGRMSTLADQALQNEKQALQNEEQASQNALRAEQSEKETANALAKVAAQKAEVEESLSGSLDYFSAALQRADGYEARKSIFALLARFDMVLGVFVEQHPQDQQLQLTLARRLAERGQKRLAEEQPAKAQAELEKSRAVFTRLVTTSNNWKVLRPLEMKAATGAKMELQSDGSVFVHQTQPANADAYTLVFQTDLKSITGLRLEVLADARLPRGGPGWGGDGNFVLNELTLDALPISYPAKLAVNASSLIAQAPLWQSLGAGPAPYLLGMAVSVNPARPIALRNPRADFSQGNWDVRGAVDGNTSTGWAIVPGVNQDHTALFELAEAVGDGQASVLTIRIRHLEPTTLGRFRLSFASDASALQATRIRWHDLKDREIADVYAALGKAHAQQRHTEEAVASFAQALPLAADRADKARIIAAAAPLEGTLAKLAQRAAGDGRFQAELARHYAKQGNAPLAEAARAKARALLEERLAKDPENATIVAELTQVLLGAQEPGNPTRWTVLKPTEMRSEGGANLTPQEDGSIVVETAANTEHETIRWQPGPDPVQALRIESGTNQAPPAKGVPFVHEYQIVAAQMATSQPGALRGRFVRLDLPGDSRQFPRVPSDGNRKCINLAELQVFHGDQNLALRKKARQSSTHYPAENAVDGNTVGNDSGNPYAHTEWENDPWWEVDLGSEQAIDRIVVWNRVEAGVHKRMNHFRIRVLDHSRKVIFERVIDKAPYPSTEIVRPTFLVESGENQPLILRLPLNPRDGALPRLRVSVASSLLDEGLEEKSLEAVKIADVTTRLAVAYALNGLKDEALQHFSTALKRADGYEARRSILEAAARFGSVVAALHKRQPDDPQLQLALARHFAEEGRQRLAEKQPAQALAELEKARAIFTRLSTATSNWKTLTPVEMKAESGANMELQKDGSVFVHQGQPAKRDTYTLVFQTELKGITGLRLEALADARLPKGGPGWSGNGNFHVSELTLQAAPADGPDKARAIALRNAWADFSEVTSETGGSDVRGAVDGNPRTSWAVWPQVNQDHAAVFELAERVDGGGASLLTIRLINQYLNLPDHNLGRLRLSFTNDRATLQAARIRGDLKDSELADLYTAFGKGYAQQGRTKEAIASFTEALHLTADRADQLKIIAEAAPFEDDLVSALGKRQLDPQLLLALARQLAERGKQRLAEKQPAQAQAELGKSLKMFTRLRAEYPAPPWRVLTPTKMSSRADATLTLQGDGSILASGRNAPADIYTLSAVTDVNRIAAVRLEALPDASLPNKGPGRHATGNFHLGGFRVFQATPDGVGKLTSLPVDSAWASYAYKARDADIAGTIDPSLGMVWHVWGRIGEAHQAVFHLQQPAAVGPDRPFVIELFHRQLPQPLNLGRFRLSVTGVDHALEAEQLRNELKDSEVADLNVALANAHAPQGHTDEAVALLTEALHLTADRAGRARIIAEAAPLKGVLEKLAERAAGDGQLQADLARQFAAQGRAALADAARAKARKLFEEKLAQETENSACAEELTQLLLDQQEQEDATRWTVLTPTDMTSKGGATLSKLPDDSILASGKNPLGDAYTIVAQAKVAQIRAIRLEALTHESLPNQGPGRDERRDRGNFAMVHFAIRAGVQGTQPRPVEMSRVAAAYFIYDLSVNHWNSGGVWGGYSRPKTAVYLAKQPVDCKGDARLEFQMEFSPNAEWPLQNLGRFRLSVSSDPDAFNGEQRRFAAMNIADPWAKLAFAYHLIGDQPALEELLKQHPAAATGFGDLYAAAQDWERAIAEYRKLVTDQPVDGALLTRLAAAYQGAGRMRESVPYLARASAADPKDTILSMKVAALQAWFGQDKELAASRQRIRAFAKDTNDVTTAERAAKMCSIRVSADKAELDAALALGRRAVKLGQGGDWNLLALGMAEYRSGNDAAADEALRAAGEAGPNNPYVTGVSAFYRAMSLYRQGKNDEARKLAIAAAAMMKPLPADGQSPLAGNDYWDDLVLWLAYKEAKALLKIDAAPAGNWLAHALADHRRGEIDQAKKAWRKAAEMMKLAGGADEALRPLLHQSVLALGRESPEARELIAAAAGAPPATLNEAIRQHPEQAKGYRDRGNWYAERGRWKDAVTDFVEVFRLDPNTLDAMRLGILLAYNGEKDRYWEHCQAMLSRWASTENNSEANQTLKTIILIPDYQGDAKQLTRLAAAAVAGDEKQAYFEWFLFAKGLHEYRTGKYAEALAACRASRKRAPESKNEPEILTALDLAIEAMALQGEGKADEARRTLDQATPWIENHVPGVDGGAWADWLSAHSLYHEAETLLAAKKVEPKK